MLTAEKRQIKFVRVDEWNRPVFEVIGKNYYLTDVNNLFSECATEQEIKDFYSKLEDTGLEKYLVFYGNSPDLTDPLGGSLKAGIKLELI